MSTILLIPIYEPTMKTLSFITELKQHVNSIIVVDDGSGITYASIFKKIQELGITVLGYAENQGKGHALKTGFSYIQRELPTTNIVTADGDGQHTVSDIQAMLHETEKLPEHNFLLGVRSFSKGTTPSRSLLGNRITSFLYYLGSGIRLEDTQTGLRGFPSASMDDLLKTKGERFEYEMNQLITLPNIGFTLETLPITTVYENNNEHSHFRTLQDSFLVYRPLLSFLLSSFSSALIDVLLFLIITAFIGQEAQRLLFATISARVLSGIFNYFINRKLVFRNQASISRSLWKYGLLFICQLFLSWIGVIILSSFIPSVLFSKLLIDLLLFFFSFTIQKRLVFNT